jgi:hypothetical protein
MMMMVDFCTGCQAWSEMWHCSLVYIFSEVWWGTAWDKAVNVQVEMLDWVNYIFLVIKLFVKHVWLYDLQAVSLFPITPKLRTWDRVPSIDLHIFLPFYFSVFSFQLCGQPGHLNVDIYNMWISFVTNSLRWLNWPKETGRKYNGR